MIYDVESYNCDITIILVNHISHISPMYVIYYTVYYMILQTEQLQ